ncbi:MAG: tripartite tricarboxylate transporter TctB family protein [Syntrophaceae bacterium]|jgi:putative tricarboxylic transport membrane protein|nr:tripartite tricarboxylate transporter TctB family protein [Syntrophaceae bacterium]
MFKNRDFWGGATLIGIGATAILLGLDYRIGSLLRMGPGFFPVILGGILILFGIFTLVKGLLRGEEIKTKCSFRALILLPLSLVLFGFLMEYAGFIPALAVLIVGSALAGREFRIFEAGLLVVVLTVLSVALFVWGLGLPYPLIKGFS